MIWLSEYGQGLFVSIRGYDVLIPASQVPANGRSSDLLKGKRNAAVSSGCNQLIAYHGLDLIEVGNDR